MCLHGGRVFGGCGGMQRKRGGLAAWAGRPSSGFRALRLLYPPRFGPVPPASQPRPCPPTLPHADANRCTTTTTGSGRCRSSSTPSSACRLRTRSTPGASTVGGSARSAAWELWWAMGDAGPPTMWQPIRGPTRGWVAHTPPPPHGRPAQAITGDPPGRPRLRGWCGRAPAARACHMGARHTLCHEYRTVNMYSDLKVSDGPF
jgi:hypothetical protein